MSGEGKPRFKSNWLTWTVDRRDRSFRVYVVEPRSYSPSDHADIFWAALNHLWHPALDYLNGSGLARQNSFASADTLPFDLLTFPEAFLDSTTLLEYLRILDPAGGARGCVHAGLRPAGGNNHATHLFRRDQILDFVNELESIAILTKADLLVFKEWLKCQGADDHFNLGCLFALDAGTQQIRICLHPKLVHSTMEQSALPHQNIKEGDLLSLVTLRPTSTEYLSINLQPLLCSDALHLDTYQPNRRPLQAMTSETGLFASEGGSRPEHIDIVSVATCTPNEQKLISQRPKRLRQTWHSEFRKTFERAAKEADYDLHKNAIFVLSNFYNLPSSGRKGGLSGVFIPLPCYDSTLHKHVDLAVFGRPPGQPRLEEERERWVYDQFDGRYNLSQGWPMTGYIAAISPASADATAVATMVGFSIFLPRDTNRNRRNFGYLGQHIYDAFCSTADDGSKKVEFKRREKIDEH